MFKGGLGQNSVSMHFQLANVIFIVLFRCVIYRGSGNINSKGEIWGIDLIQESSRVIHGPCKFSADKLAEVYITWLETTSINPSA